MDEQLKNQMSDNLVVQLLQLSSFQQTPFHQTTGRSQRFRLVQSCIPVTTARNNDITDAVRHSFDVSSADMVQLHLCHLR